MQVRFGDDASDSRRFCFCALHSVAVMRRPSPLRDPSAETIARGKALTDAGDCAGCHTADPAKPFAGGKRIDTPFGAIYSPNLTPDRDTGIGAWSDEDFRRALREGVAPDGSRYYPGFPLSLFHQTDPRRYPGDPRLSCDADTGSATPRRRRSCGGR